MPSEILQKPGTQVTWAPAGGTYAMTLTNLANAAGREGVKHDFGATHASRWRWYLITKFAVAPTVRKTVRIYFAWSHDNTIFDGEHGGADAALAEADNLDRMQLIGVHVCDDDTAAQYSGGIFFVQTRYGAPCVYNDSGQALTNTAGDHEFIIEPLKDEAQ